MTKSDLESFANTIRPIIREFTAKELGPLLERHRELESRIRELESRPILKFCGPWEKDRAYVAGSVVSFDGSAWVAQDSTSDRPGAGQTSWRLAVKRGTDGKDARP